jgi:hypothetical protein
VNSESPAWQPVVQVGFVSGHAFRRWLSGFDFRHGRRENFGDSLYPYGKNGRHEETRTPDHYRVNYEVSHLKPFSSLAFPFFGKTKIPLKRRGFGDDLVTSFVSLYTRDPVSECNCDVTSTTQDPRIYQMNLELDELSGVSVMYR